MKNEYNGYKEGYEKVRKIGLADKYAKFAWTQFKIDETERKIPKHMSRRTVNNHAKDTVVDWASMVRDVLHAYDKGEIDNGELIGILQCYTFSAESNFQEENNDDS